MRRLIRTRFGSALLWGLLAPAAFAQTRDTTRRVSGAIVRGVVVDSVARAPLGGAMVQLVAADTMVRFARTATADSLGRFALDDVPDGRYALGFFHPMLDSLGLEPVLREVNVQRRQPVTIDLAIPSPARLRTAICGPRSTRDSGAVIIGVVREVRNGDPLAGITVTGEWMELSLGRGGVARRIPKVDIVTHKNGWFAMCDVPTPGTVTLRASRGADSTDDVEVLVPAEGFLRRELYLGPARVVVANDTVPRDTLAVRVTRHRAGEGRLSGTVVTEIDGQSLAGAQVSIVDGPVVRANARGEWTLTGVPLGTRMLEVRAISYYPERRAVDVIDGARPIRVAMSTLKAVLDTVKIAANLRVRDMVAFQERRRSGAGRYVTVDDIERRRPLLTTDLFANMAGVRLDRRTESLLVRGAVSEWCEPALFIDGQQILGQNRPDDVDSWAHPDEIVGIEVYAGNTAPAQFQPGLSGCGSIVIWTKLLHRTQPMSKRGVVSAVSLLTLSLAVAALLLRR